MRPSSCQAAIYITLENPSTLSQFKPRCRVTPYDADTAANYAYNPVGEPILRTFGGNLVVCSLPPRLGNDVQQIPGRFIVEIGNVCHASPPFLPPHRVHYRNGW